MFDVKLDCNGDIEVSENGDISITNSVRQQALIRLRWIYDEWRLGPELGFPWFKDVFVKNPNVERIRMLIRSEIAKIENIKNVVVTDVKVDKDTRTLAVKFTFTVNKETFQEEVTMYG